VVETATHWCKDESTPSRLVSVRRDTSCDVVETRQMVWSFVGQEVTVGSQVRDGRHMVGVGPWCRLCRSARHRE